VGFGGRMIFGSSFLISYLFGYYLFGYYFLGSSRLTLGSSKAFTTLFGAFGYYTDFATIPCGFFSFSFLTAAI
jgi:hypothetical protein